MKYVQIDYNSTRPIAFASDSSDGTLIVGERVWGYAEGDGTRVPAKVLEHVVGERWDFYRIGVDWMDMEEDPEHPYIEPAVGSQTEEP